MKSKLFEMVLHESEDKLQQVTNEKELSTLLNMGCTVYAHHTGPFGENTGARVIGFGKVKDLRDELNGVEDIMEEDLVEYESSEDWLDANEDMTVVALNKPIGQSRCTFYVDADNIDELELWAFTSDFEKCLKSEKGSDKNEKTCPNCGGEEFYYVKLPKLVLGHGKFKACAACGAMYPTELTF